MQSLAGPSATPGADNEPATTLISFHRRDTARLGLIWSQNVCEAGNGGGAAVEYIISTRIIDGHLLRYAVQWAQSVGKISEEKLCCIAI